MSDWDGKETYMEQNLFSRIKLSKKETKHFKKET